MADKKTEAPSLRKAGRNRVISSVLAFLVLAGLLFISPACSSQETPAKFTGGPRISFDQESAYLGQATPSQRIEYEFRFRNIGDAALVIYQITSKTLLGC
jgi:hypothetical protein